MTPTFDNGVVQLYEGDCLEVMRDLPAESVQTCVTSPPYWGLRDYGLPPAVWGRDEGCEHVWGIETTQTAGRNDSGVSASSGDSFHGQSDGYGGPQIASQGAFCACGAWRGSLGLEPTIDLYVEHMVEVFREVRRVLRDDGTVWLNMGDNYSHSQSGGGSVLDDGRTDGRQSYDSDKARGRKKLSTLGSGLKPKDLCGMPWRVAFALQADGWWLRSDIVWSKPNPMPESVTDRPTRSHEYVFLLSKSARYYYDAEAIRTPAIAPRTKMPDGWDTDPGAHGAFHRNGREKGARVDKQGGHSRRHDGFNDRWDSMPKAEQQSFGANKRTVWEIATEPYSDAHFATFPQKLVEPCILAGTPNAGVVLDPFVGSGTTAFVAQKLGRRCIGIDLSAEYLKLAEKRLRGQTLPMALT